MIGRIFAVGSFLMGEDELREARRMKRREAISDLVKYNFGLTIFGGGEEREILKD
jgi:hypothetical protein